MSRECCFCGEKVGFTRFCYFSVHEGVYDASLIFHWDCFMNEDCSSLKNEIKEKIEEQLGMKALFRVCSKE